MSKCKREIEVYHMIKNETENHNKLEAKIINNS